MSGARRVAAHWRLCADSHQFHGRGRPAAAASSALTTGREHLTCQPAPRAPDPARDPDPATTARIGTAPGGADATDAYRTGHSLQWWGLTPLTPLGGMVGPSQHPDH